MVNATPQRLTLPLKPAQTRSMLLSGSLLYAHHRDTNIVARLLGSHTFLSILHSQDLEQTVWEVPPGYAQLQPQAFPVQ